MDNSVRGQLDTGTMDGQWDNGTIPKLDSETLGDWDNEMLVDNRTRERSEFSARHGV
jgi:hypothetical protein